MPDVVRYVLLCGLLVGCLVVAGGPSAAIAQDNDTTAEAAASPTKADLEKKFAESLDNVVMTGKFTVVGKPEAPNREEKYQISSAKKVGEDTWIITSRIQYGGKNQTLPLPVPVKVYWAGDTPVISLTDVTIPGMGTFTARVMIYDDHYAGYWRHGEVGGHMYGTISKMEAEKPAE